MQRRFIPALLLAALGWWHASCRADDSTNLISNGSFENGTTEFGSFIPAESQGDNCRFTTTAEAAHSGSLGALLQSDNFSRYGIAASASTGIVSGQRYRIGIWVKPGPDFQVKPGTPGFLIRVNLNQGATVSPGGHIFIFPDGSVSRGSQTPAYPAKTSPLPADWSHVEAVIEAPADADSMNPSFFSWLAKGSLYADDFTAEKVDPSTPLSPATVTGPAAAAAPPTATPPATPLTTASSSTAASATAPAAPTGPPMKNPSFEDGKTGWHFGPATGSESANCRFSVVTDSPHTGKACALIQADDFARCSLEQGTFPVTPGDRYRVSIWVRAAADALAQPGTPGVVIRLTLRTGSADAPGGHLFVQLDNVVTQGLTPLSRDAPLPTDWTEMTGVVEIPPGADHCDPGIYLWLAKGSVYFDDYSIEKVDPSVAPTPVTAPPPPATKTSLLTPLPKPSA
jgi:hypothetical protein